jgi:signal transduction histidine kinase
VMIRTDRRALSQIVLNLANNAIKFTAQGSVRLELAHVSRDGAQFAAIHVVDTGIGIKPEDKEKLFGSFQRLNEESHIEGTGLGLYLSGKLVKLIGGHVEFESEYGRGSRFMVLVPKA